MGFLNHFSFPVLAEMIEDGERIADDVCEAAYKLRDSDDNAKLLSRGWSEGKRAESKEDYKEYGFTSHGRHQLLSDDRFHGIHNAIVKQAEQYSSKMQSNPRFHITNSWVSIYGDGHFVPEHIHTHAHLSCVFYAAATEGTGNIIFRNPAYAVYAMNYGHGDPYFCDKFEVQPKKGMLIIFPSFMPHLTKPHEANEDRIILSSNMSFDDERL